MNSHGRPSDRFKCSWLTGGQSACLPGCLEAPKNSHHLHWCLRRRLESFINELADMDTERET